MIKYEQAVAGEWFEIHNKRMRQMCCDCHLVHVWEFRIKDGRLEARVKADQRATKAARARYNVEVK